MSDDPRHVYFDACFNFRDLGGYETAEGRTLRWNTLYRSDTLHRLTAEDEERFRELGLRTVVDLRSALELEDHGQLSVVTDDGVWHHVPMLDNVKLAPRDPSSSPIEAAASPAPAPGEHYVGIVEQYGESVATVFALLARPGAFPAVFHCTSGKDRTGIIAALLLDFLGVPDDVIANDYVLTEAARARSTPWIKANEPQFAAFLAQIPKERRVMSADTILGFLEGVRSRFGSIPKFLAAIGVDDADLQVLRDRLLED